MLFVRAILPSLLDWSCISAYIDQGLLSYLDCMLHKTVFKESKIKITLYGGTEKELMLTLTE